MINLLFKRGQEAVALRIIGSEVQIGMQQGGYFKLAPIEGVQLSVEGILKEFPELKGKSPQEIKKEGVKRFREHLKKFKSEEEVKEYFIKEMLQMGYELIMSQKNNLKPEFVKKNA
jgi:hypothetical protein